VVVSPGWPTCLKTLEKNKVREKQPRSGQRNCFSLCFSRFWDVAGQTAGAKTRDFLILPTTVFFFAVNGGAWLLVEDNKISSPLPSGLIIPV